MTARPKGQKTGAGSSTELKHVARLMYKQNLELSERNKTLSLLRKIDEIVLSTVTNPKHVAQEVADAVLADTDFVFMAIFIAAKKAKLLTTYAIAARNTLPLDQLGLKDTLLKLRIPFHSDNNTLTEAISQKTNLSTDALKKALAPHLTAKAAQQIQDFSGMASLFVCPLIVRDEVLGVMLVGGRKPATHISSYQRNLIDRLTGVVGIAMDSALLYQEIQNARAALEKANQNLKELDKAKDEFISLASHQLRTPLTAIKGYLSMLLQGDAGKMSGQQQRFATEAFDASNRMVALINDLLNVSRMQAGRFFLETKLVNLLPLITQTIDQLARTAERKGLQLSFKPPKKAVLALELDENKTLQVIVNFIDNALYYTQKGSVTVSLEVVGKEVVFRVKDTGIGVPEAEKKQLFQKMFRASNARHVRPDGTGLGIYMAKRVIEEQGGKVIFESEEGKGSTFGFRLPIKN